MPDISREELTELVKSIMTIRDKDGRLLSEEEHCELVKKFIRSINHPSGSDLIYYPQLVAEFAELNREPTVEEIVELAIKGAS